MKEKSKIFLQYLSLGLAFLAVLFTIIYPTENILVSSGGYLGVFTVSLISAISLFPGPSGIATFIAGGTLNPFIISIISGLGSSIGETTGYLAGFGSHGIIKENIKIPWLDRYKFFIKFKENVAKWMKNYPFITLFLIAAIPNFFVDIAGVIAGRARYSYIKFFAAMLFGKIIRFSLSTFFGYFILSK